MTIIEQLNELRKDHHYAMTKLYQAQGGAVMGESEDYWRGVVVGLEAVLDMLGVEHESYNPLR